MQLLAGEQREPAVQQAAHFTGGTRGEQLAIHGPSRVELFLAFVGEAEIDAGDAVVRLLQQHGGERGAGITEAVRRVVRLGEPEIHIRIGRVLGAFRLEGGELRRAQGSRTGTARGTCGEHRAHDCDGQRARA